MEISSTARRLTMPTPSTWRSTPLRPAIHGDTILPQRHKHRSNIRWRPRGYEVSSDLGVSPIIKGQRPLSTQKWTSVWLTHGRYHAPDTASADTRPREYLPESLRRRSADAPRCAVR